MSDQPALVAEVVLLQGVPQPLTYTIPPALAAQIQPGVGVRVPLGSRSASGYVSTTQSKLPAVDYQLKALAGLDPMLPAMPADHLPFVLASAAYYRVAPGDFLAMALPPTARAAATRYVADPAALSNPPRGELQRAIIGVLRDGPASVTRLARRLSRGHAPLLAALRRMQEKGLVSARTEKRPGTGRPVIAVTRFSGDELEATATALERRAPRAVALWRSLPKDEAVQVRQLTADFPSAHSQVQRLERAGLVSLGTMLMLPDGVMVPIYAPDESGLTGAGADITLTIQQREALDAVSEALDKEEYQGLVLHGVTGSGKTEVYLRAIEELAQLGRQALVLVPEIALTPQLMQRFVVRFGEQAVGIWHSELSFAQRRSIWEQAASGELTILLGARSALFVPLPRLALVVVDEEHDTSYKQDETPRYHARDLALLRAHQAKAVALLGSATPSLESFHNGQEGKLKLLSMPERATPQPLPQVELVDMRNEKRAGDTLLSGTLLSALEETVAAGRQAILFLNRRGFAPYVLCGKCGHQFTCEHCAVSLTHHMRRAALLCHYCGMQLPLPEICPACKSDKIKQLGLGTERLESALAARLPDARLARLDRDTISSRRRMEDVLVQFATGELDILLGTQMVTKGHDFPGVTLVGVVNADASLNFPDFRAAERTFQLITQVSGRAGRGEEAGRVLVQTFNPEHYAVSCAAAHDFPSFVEQELALRRLLRYPPYSHLALIRTEDEREGRAQAVAEQIAGRLRDALAQLDLQDVELLGPAPAPLSRLRGRYRVQLLIKARTRAALRRLLTNAAIEAAKTGETRVILDLDPVNML